MRTLVIIYIFSFCEEHLAQEIQDSVVPVGSKCAPPIHSLAVSTAIVDSISEDGHELGSFSHCLSSVCRGWRFCLGMSCIPPLLLRHVPPWSPVCSFEIKALEHERNTAFIPIPLVPPFNSDLLLSRDNSKLYLCRRPCIFMLEDRENSSGWKRRAKSSVWFQIKLKVRSSWFQCTTAAYGMHGSPLYCIEFMRQHVQITYRSKG